MSTTTQHYKFSDVASDKKVFELHVGTCAKPPGHFNIYDETRSDFFAVAILVQGNVTVKLNLKEKRISKNNIMFLPPNTIKQVINASDDVRVYTVIFTAKFLLQIGVDEQEIEMINFNARNGEEIVALEEKEVDSLKKIIEDLRIKNENIHEHPFGEDIVKYTFRIFLSEMSAVAVRHKLLHVKNTTRKQDLVIQFGNLVNLNFRQNRSVKFYADQLAITPKYLTEIVHEVTGEPASALIDEKVMYEAKLLLKNPRLTIAQIAETLNFSDQSFLGKFFKRHLGLSPSQYRSHRLA